MHNPLFIAILAGLGGMLGWGSADFFAKKTIDRIGAIKSLVLAHGFGTALFLSIIIGQSLVKGKVSSLPTTAGAWAGLVFFGCLQMVVYWLAYEGFGKGQLSILNPVFASYSGLVAIIAVVFLGETLHFMLGIALLFIFIGILLLNTETSSLSLRKFVISPGLPEVALAAVLAAGWTVGWDKFIGSHDPLTYAAAMYAFMTIAALALAKIMKVRLTGVKPELWKFILLIGAGETAAYLAISWGYSATSLTSIVALISGSFSLPTVILAYIFLKEKISLIQLAGVVAVILGVGIVTLS
jgi:drug/metabolite transporter (DMT)-like permease